MLEQTIWLWNHTSHTKVYFNEFVPNVLRDNMGMIIFDLQVFEGFEMPKASYVSGCTLWHFNSTFSSPLSTSSAYKRFTKKFSSVMNLSLHTSNSRTKPAELDFEYCSNTKVRFCAKKKFLALVFQLQARWKQSFLIELMNNKVINKSYEQMSQRRVFLGNRKQCTMAKMARLCSKIMTPP